ncbi:hypothetical protein AC249_AIPGENE10654 [Exaiptasia diaphana]|nr:hypothetical protein AC249_AIPGENE10654 [Exaiptasia diaphana]
MALCYFIAAVAAVFINILAAVDALPSAILASNMQIDDVIREYFNAGYEYSNIVSLLLAYHGIRIRYMSSSGTKMVLTLWSDVNTMTGLFKARLALILSYM